MSRKLIGTLTALYGVLVSAGCISVDVAPNAAPQRSESVQVQPPQGAFEDLESQFTDDAWKHSETGSTIAYLSDCSPSSDQPLKRLRQGVMESMENSELLKSNYRQYNRRRGLFSTIQGDVDGVPTKVRLVIFKKNSCAYFLSYTALEETYQNQLSSFQGFIQRFQVK